KHATPVPAPMPAADDRDSNQFIELGSGDIDTGGLSTPTPVYSERPHQQGSFGEQLSPARLFGRLAAERETGELVLERGDVIKEIFLVQGAPEFVSSNVASERL